MIVLSALIFTWIVGSVAANRVYSLDFNELNALQDLFESAGGNQWHWIGLDGIWNFSVANPEPCAAVSLWQGLNCSCQYFGIATDETYNCSIVEINLQGYRMYGTIPPSISSFTNLSTLNFYNNSLYGSVPDSIGNFSALNYIYLDTNSLSCTIPSSLCHLSSVLIELYLGTNQFERIIPSCLGRLSLATRLDLRYNQLTGTIPETFLGLTAMEKLYLEDNYLSGTIPSIFGSLTQLIILDVGSNDLSGSIPSCVKYLSNLEVLELLINSLTGTIPAFLGTLTKLYWLNIEYNRFTGTIPPSIGNLNQMDIFEISQNFLTGPLPASFGNYSLVTDYAVRFNMLTGTIPSDFSLLVDGINCFFASNYFTGPMPGELFQFMSDLAYLDLGTNYFTGTIPSVFVSLTTLQQLYLFSNLLTGSINGDIANLINLQSLQLYSNDITGTIPYTIGQLSYLQTLFLYNNSISGSIPTSIALLTGLQEFQVQSNRLTGNLNDVFDGASQQSLTVIQLCDNQLTGTIPEDVFLLPSLQVFAVVSNCFVGPLPSTMCSSASLLSLLLDGIHTATSCRQPVIPGISSAYSLYPLSGGFSTCLFSMAKLTTLHLSGNGLTGSLPANLNVSDQLTDLSLSHNLFSGPIPNFMQEREWSSLDLSYNRFSGTLSSEFHDYNSNSSLSLQVNRISGDIPSTLKYATDINILNGNIFYCDLQGSSLPVHDPNYQLYSCGSNTFNIPYYVWLLVTAIGFAAIVYLQIKYYGLKLLGSQAAITGGNASKLETLQKYGLQLVGRFHCYYSIFSQSFEIPIPDRTHSPELSETSRKMDIRNIKNMGKLFVIVRRFAFVVGLYILVVLVPVYAVVSKYYSSYTFSYAWLISIGYFSGKEAAILVLASLLGFIVPTLYFAPRVLGVFEESDTNQPIEMHGNQVCPLQHFPPMDVSPRSDSSLSDSNMSWMSRSLSMTSTATAQSATTTTTATNSKHPSFIFSSWWVFGGWCFILLINFVVVIGVNVVFVVISLIGNSTQVFFAQVLLALFKSMWSSEVFRWMVHELQVRRDIRMKVKSDGDTHGQCQGMSSSGPTSSESGIEFGIKHVDSRGEDSGLGDSSPRGSGDALCDPTPAGGNDLSGNKHTSHGADAAASPIIVRNRLLSTQILVALFNTIAIPCIVVGIIDSDCYYNLFFISPSVVGYYQYVSECTLLATTVSETGQKSQYCAIYSTPTSKTSYVPPFSYSYECSSSFITHYAAAFVYLAILMGIIAPLIQISLQQWFLAEQSFLLNVGDSEHKRQVALDDISRSQSVENSPFQDNIELQKSIMTKSAPSEWQVCRSRWIYRLLDIVLPPTMKPTKYLQQEGARFYLKRSLSRHLRHLANEQQHRDRGKYFAVDKHIITIVTFVGLLMTFGIAFPPLGIAFICVIWTSTYFTQLKFGYFVSTAVQHQELLGFVKLINNECKQFSQSLRKTLFLIVIASCLFFAAFLFDTLGSAEGLDASVWIFAFLTLFPFAVISVFYLCRRFRAATYESTIRNRETHMSTGMELT